MAKGSAKKVAGTVSNIEVPEPSLEHLRRLTDDTGLYQHAKIIIPDRECGYCTDDNARAVIAMTRYCSHYADPQALELLNTYLAFVLHSQNSDGTIRNWMNFERTWYENEPGNDALGRALWAFGTVVADPPSTPSMSFRRARAGVPSLSLRDVAEGPNPPSPAYLSMASDGFERSIGLVQRQLPKGMAYSILGMSDYLKRFPDAGDIKHQLELAANGLLTQYEENSHPDWQWFEEILTYDNAVLPHALFVAGSTLGDKKYAQIAKKTCEFLLANTFNGEHFSFIGCHGWYKRGRPRAAFDQQPIEAASTVLMLKAAYDCTGDERFLTLQRKAFDWFLGANDLGIALYDSSSKGCCDGLCPDGVNTNQGAESTLSFLLSLIAIKLGNRDSNPN